jgi:excisionase family DNA binding protein
MVAACSRRACGTYRQKRSIAMSETVHPLLYTPAEVAVVTNLSERAIQRACADGQLRGIQFGKLWRIPPQSVADLLQMPVADVQIAIAAVRAQVGGAK